MNAQNISRRELSVLPEFRGGTESRTFVYAAEFSDATVKVGASRNIRLRAEGLCDMARSLGFEVTGFYVRAFPGAYPFPVEAAVIECLTKRFGPAAYGREWFSGVPLQEAIAAVNACIDATPAAPAVEQGV